MRAVSSLLIGVCVCGLAAAQLLAQASQTPTTAETFSAQARATNAGGGSVSGSLVVAITRYTPDFDRKTVEDALRINGYPGFVRALRTAPIVGSVELGGATYTIRWARQTPSPEGRTIVVITDRPMVFIGGGLPNAKPREGYEVALIQLVLDKAGKGTGTMAGAARVKPGGETGVQIDDYADSPITLSAVTRK